MSDFDQRYLHEHSKPMCILFNKNIEYFNTDKKGIV